LLTTFHCCHSLAISLFDTEVLLSEFVAIE
jgi:hypothetical protein